MSGDLRRRSRVILDGPDRAQARAYLKGIGFDDDALQRPIVGIANRSPYSTWESNVRATYSLLEACRTVGGSGEPPRVVVASSDHAYGDHEELPHREDFALKALYPYDFSKACADIVARSYADAAGLPVAVTRMANTFGGGDLNWSRIVPDTARALIAGRPPVIRSVGTPERDYLYV